MPLCGTHLSLSFSNPLHLSSSSLCLHSPQVPHRISQRQRPPPRPPPGAAASSAPASRHRALLCAGRQRLPTPACPTAVGRRASCRLPEAAHARDGAVLGTQLGTPRGRYVEHSNKFLLVVKPRFIEPVGESQTSEGDAC
jgi:hypothetical protein